MLGLILFGITLLAAEGRVSERWLLPLGWVWVNTHGSFPLGIVYLLACVVGARLDGQRPRQELRCTAHLVVGVALGVIGPLGLRGLTFPVDLLRRQDLLSHVVEWQAPAFQSLSERAFLIELVVAIVLLVRQPRYRNAIPMVVFVVAALLGARNLTVASMVLLPGMASATTGLGSLSSAMKPRLAAAWGLACICAVGLLVTARLQQPVLQLSGYPIDAIAYLEVSGVDTSTTHMAAPEIVGNLLTYVYGVEGRRVFYDDRFDMYPASVSEAALAVQEGSPDVFSKLDELDVDLVTTPWTSPLALALRRDPAWRIIFLDEHWLLSCRRDVDVGGSIGRC
jgi:hypothetical protein